MLFCAPPRLLPVLLGENQQLALPPSSRSKKLVGREGRFRVLRILKVKKEYMKECPPKCHVQLNRYILLEIQ